MVGIQQQRRAKFLLSDIQINERDTNVMQKRKQHDEIYRDWDVRGYFRSVAQGGSHSEVTIELTPKEEEPGSCRSG